LEELARQRSEAEEELRKLLARRKTLKIEHVLTRERISGVREEVARRLQQQAGEKVRIRVQRNADALQYQEKLTAALKGSNLRNQGDIISALTKVRPEDLAKIISDNDAEELETQTALGRERGRKILEALKLSEDPLKLEVVGTDDKVCIELNVSTGGDANFKDASELSRGQKCTALLPILLARQGTPLVIDQPEDNLDNHFIYETVVGTILRLKERRQMIFITHNANIPVLGGADLVLVMNSDGRRGFVQKTGSVDECRTEIIDLLEGGEEAFELRRRRYGRE
jgi:ABC-type glutathione transport system ATPase component